MPDSPSSQKKDSSSAEPPGLDKKLRRIARARTRLAVCFWTLPIYVAAIWVLLNNGHGIDSMMWIYIAVYAVFAVDMSMRHCPVCHQQFYVKNIFLNLLSKQCAHCGQTSAPGEFPAED